jgi:hypothetical protein
MSGMREGIRMMEREALIELWDEAWRDGLWAAAWSRALDGVTAEQAAWKPAPDRHSIWQSVHHVLFWRDVTLRRTRGEPRPDDAEIARCNWEEPAEASAAAWQDTARRYEASHREMVRALKTADQTLERFLYHLFHDNYHIGQIMQLRAMRGFAPIE